MALQTDRRCARTILIAGLTCSMLAGCGAAANGVSGSRPQQSATAAASGAASSNVSPNPLFVQPQGPTIAWHGTVPGVLTHRPQFVLSDTAGRRFEFSRATQGKPTLLFFGYTHCPDVCPTTMADVAIALRHVPASIRHAVAVVFVTTDPRRDTGAVLRQWLHRFDPTFIGLTGTQAQVDAAQKATGLPLAQAETDSGANYAVAHAAQVAGYGPDDIEHVLYFANAQAADYAADLPQLAAMGE